MKIIKLACFLFITLLIFIGCEQDIKTPEPTGPDTTYFPCGSGYQWFYLKNGNESIRIELTEEYTNENRRVYLNSSSRFHVLWGWLNSCFSFPDVGYLWGRDDDFVYYYHDNERFSFSLWLEEGDTIIATSGSMPLMVEYKEDSLILKRTYTTLSGEEIRDGTYRIARAKGIGIVTIIDTVTYQGEYRSHISYTLEYFATPDSVIFP